MCSIKLLFILFSVRLTLFWHLFLESSAQCQGIAGTERTDVTAGTAGTERRDVTVVTAGTENTGDVLGDGLLVA